MNTDSQFNDRSRLHSADDASCNVSREVTSRGDVQHTNDLTGAMDMVKRNTSMDLQREGFELLSAYLDGEVTAAERKQVEELLASDPSVQKLHNRLLKLRHGLRSIPVPQQQPVEVTVKKVLERLQHRRSRLIGLFGGAAIAACAFGAISGLFSGESNLQQFAQRSTVTQPNAQQAKEPVISSNPSTGMETTATQPSKPTLMVAINSPIVPIPKAARSAPESKSIDKDMDLQQEVPTLEDGLEDGLN